MAVIVVCLGIPFRTWGQVPTDMSAVVMTVPLDSLGYYSDFAYTQEEIDSLLLHSPQIALFSEKVKARNRSESFLRSLSFHFTYSPFDEPIPESRKAWLGFTLPVGKLLQDTKKLDEAELVVAVQSLRVQARELMVQRAELLVELELERQQYRTVLLKEQKAEVSLAVHQASSDAVLDARDALAERLAAIQKTKLSVRLVEERLNALIGEW